jgi:16S rRNA (guanine(1405)-N(7))-methyltransferase
LTRDHELDELVAAVLASSKYRRVAPEFIRNVGARELGRQRKLKDAIKATKNKLHQVAGAYQLSERAYERWLDELRASAGDQEAQRAICRRIMEQHASTRERLPILEQFYAQIFQVLPPVRSIADLACGLNPLALPWMPLPADGHYAAYDIYQDMMSFLAQCMALLGVAGQAEPRDILQSPPSAAVDVALLLKAVPCLEQVDRHAGRGLLQAINARHVVVSFPVRSLGGRSKGMEQHYEQAMEALLDGTGWRAARYLFASELVFVVDKG